MFDFPEPLQTGHLSLTVAWPLPLQVWQVFLTTELTRPVPLHLTQFFSSGRVKPEPPHFVQRL
jgi:hypothetical protein